MEHNFPTSVEWLDGTKRDYVGYDIEVNAGVLLLTRPETRAVVIPAGSVRQLTVGGTVLVST